MIEDYVTKNYVDISYKVKSVNPKRELIVTVETDDTILQYLDIRAKQMMYISLFGDTDYEQGVSKHFTVSVYYEGEENNKLQRTWTVSGPYVKELVSTIFRPDLDQSKEEFEKPFSYFVLGSCESFVYRVHFDGGEEQVLSFNGEFSDTYKEIEYQSYTLKYRFMNKYSSGDLREKNAFVELSLSRSYYHINSSYTGTTDLDINVGCEGDANKEIGPDNIFFLGLPLFPSDITVLRLNCLSFDQSSPESYFGPLTVGRKSRHLCCKTQGNLYSNTYLWFNGEIVQPDDLQVVQPGNAEREAIKDLAIRPLYDDEAGDDVKRYTWFQETVGYYQCFVGTYTYEIGTGDKQPRYPVVKHRNYKMGFQISPDFFHKQLTIDLTRTESFIPSLIQKDLAPLIRPSRNAYTEGGTNVTAYQITNQLEKELTVVKGSCVGLVAMGVVFPHEKISWDATTGTSSGSMLFSNRECSETYVGETILNTSDDYKSLNPSFKYSYDPYDKVTIESQVYVGFINDEQIIVTVSMGGDDSRKRNVQKEYTITIKAVAPFLDFPKLQQAPDFNSVTCTVKGYPIESVTITAIDKKKATTVIGTYDVRTDEKEENEVVLSASLKDNLKKAKCTASNSLIEPRNRTSPITELAWPKTSSGMTLIVAAVIGIALLVLIIWIVCACVAMARHPQTKFGEAMCCRTGAYSQIEKIPMDPYKLEYFTLNPGVTLGGGHFGIVRRGNCTALKDRAGERTDIAIKEVKPCIDRMRREDDLRRERDIMMRLRSHSNVLRIYGYTDEPDQLALVIEFAAFGSLDKLLIEARKMKSDGYLMPNEQIENPIKAFESKHIIEFSRQISDGMDYVGRNQIVHRDLAARNVVVSGDGGDYVLKITDFGLAREISDDGFYERVEGKEIPIKWTAPESLRGNIYTSKSDVWSYGITLWEICTLGGEPYAGYNNAETMENVRTGYRLQKPPSCNIELYELMTRCWLESPEERPTFAHILTQLTSYSQKPSDYVHIESLYETDLNLTLRLQTLEPPPTTTPSNNHHPSSLPHTPVREHGGGAGSHDSCNSPRDYRQPDDGQPAAGSMVENEYTVEPSTLPHNEAV
ncbi:mast/stem cell growth factor receptor Kit-like isoform X2 [Bolinopsis microptera]|uniref:mast/stem cell growth factor receptor Kit-like isoform X2 n=1 Tax=Bolinopsis microptera TaxID=2820187 RepID=UPI00307A3173